MNCAEFEIRLADYLDGALDHPSKVEEKSALEAHRAECAACAELARDAGGAMAFMERAADVETPPEVVTRILFEITSGPSRAQMKPSWTRRIFGKWLEPILQPRYAMGMAMTVLSFAMLGRFTGIRRQLTPADLDPVKIWTSAEDRAQRVWERSVKYYENLRVVFEIQTQLKEWTDEQPPAKPGAEKTSTTK
jgi:anti-sigma factor RsiW